jgi:signal-transduction protein with cAMP-binding, CBS, and nucleotidyltransferase domain
MSERTRFQSQILLQLSRLARWCSGLARSYSSKRKGLHRSVRLRSNTCTSTTRFRKFRGTESRALGQDSRFESSFTNSAPRLLSKKFFSPIEQIKPDYFGGANFEARTVKDIIEPAKSISNKVSARAALDQMQAQATDSSPVVDQCGELLGILSKNKMNRNVGGFGHDPMTEPVEAHIEKNNACCFEDQTIAEAEQMMLNTKLGEVFVITREKLLVGTINIEAIAQKKR